MKVLVKAFLNVRVGKPSVNAPSFQFLAPGSELEVDGILYTGDFFEGSNKWMKDAVDNYYWAGGVQQLAMAAPDLPSIFFSYNTLFKNIPDNIRTSKGEGINVAVLDSGVFEQHPDLLLAFDKTRNPSFNFTNSVNGTNDMVGHGTHVSGLIGARSDGNVGIVGIAPGCNLRNIKVLDDFGESSSTALLMGLKEAKRLPVDIINLSLSIGIAEHNSIKNSFEEFAKNTIIVAAAGNDDELITTNIFFPAMSPHMISVGSISKRFIANSKNPKFHKRLDYIIPRIEFMSCGLKEKSFYVKDNGSSMSTALLSGLIALIMRATNNKSIDHVRQTLDSFAVKYDQQLDPNSITLIKPV